MINFLEKNEINHQLFKEKGRLIVIISSKFSTQKSKDLANYSKKKSLYFMKYFPKYESVINYERVPNKECLL